MTSHTGADGRTHSGPGGMFGCFTCDAWNYQHPVDEVTQWRWNYNGRGWSAWTAIEDTLLKPEHGDREPYWMIEFRTVGA